MRLVTVMMIFATHMVLLYSVQCTQRSDLDYPHDHKQCRQRSDLGCSHDPILFKQWSDLGYPHDPIHYMRAALMVMILYSVSSGQILAAN